MIMGIMEKMRNSTASILWILIFSFGILWVLADVDFFSGVTQGPTNLGQVNGDPITLEEFNQRVSFYTDQFTQQTGVSMTPEMRSLYENQSWEDLVAARLIQQKISDLGIVVTDNELIEMVMGENPDPFIRQQFADQDGVIDRIALRAAIDAPENSQAWIMIEQQLRDNRRQQKMSNFIMSGLRVSSLDIENEFVRTNSIADVRFLRFPFADVTDDEISVSEDELRRYHRENADQFQRSETYRFRFVSWEKIPTAQDTLNAIEDVAELREAFALAENDSLFLLRNQSVVPFRGEFVEESDIRDEFRPVLDLEIGEVSEVMMINNAPHVFKKIDRRGSAVRFGVLSFPVVADPIRTLDRLAENAEEFEFFAAADGFETEAERRGLEVIQATATKDNPFIVGLGVSQVTLDALQNLRVNRISSPIELDDRFIVVQMQERISAGTRPLDEVRSQVETAVRNQKRRQIMTDRVMNWMQQENDLDALAELTGSQVQVADAVSLNSTTLPGAGREVEVIGAIFGMERGEVRGPVTGQNAVFVLEAGDVFMADPSEMRSSQRNEIRSRLEQQKFMAFNEVFIDRLKADARIRDNRSQMLVR